MDGTGRGASGTLWVPVQDVCERAASIYLIDAVSALIGQPKTVDYGSIEGKLQMVSTRGGYRCSLYERVRDARVSGGPPGTRIGNRCGLTFFPPLRGVRVKPSGFSAAVA